MMRVFLVQNLLPKAVGIRQGLVALLQNQKLTLSKILHHS